MEEGEGEAPELRYGRARVERGLRQNRSLGKGTKTDLGLTVLLEKHGCLKLAVGYGRGILGETHVREEPGPSPSP